MDQLYYISDYSVKERFNLTEEASHTIVEKMVDAMEQRGYDVVRARGSLNPDERINNESAAFDEMCVYRSLGIA